MGLWAEEGLDDLFDTYFATASDYYVALVSTNVVTKTDQWADLTEVTGSGYAKIALTTITVATYATDDRKATGNQVTFSATGNWTTARNWVLVTPGVASGTWVIVASNGLDGGATTLVSGESLNVTVQVNATG